MPPKAAAKPVDDPLADLLNPPEAPSDEAPDPTPKTDVVEKIEAGATMLDIPIEKLIPSDTANVRREVDPDALASLLANVKEHGVRNPVWVGAPDAEGNYPLIAGYRRRQVCEDLGLETVPALVMSATDPDDMHLLAIIENTSRQDLGTLDQIRSIDWLIGRFPKRLLQKGRKGAKKGAKQINVTALAAMMGTGEWWTRCRARAHELIGIENLEKVGEKIATDAADESLKDGKKVTWGRVLAAVTSPDAEAYAKEIVEMADGDVPPDLKDKVKPERSLNSDAEVYQSVKFDALDKAGVRLKLGAKPGTDGKNVMVVATIEVGRNIGAGGFSQGERGNAKTTKLFEALADRLNSIATLGTEEEPSPGALDARVGIREAIDQSIEKLRTRIAAE